MVAKVQTSFFGADSLRNAISSFDEKANRVIAGQMLYAKPESVTHMKNNAPWTDRTGNARAGLNAEVKFSPNVAELVLAGGVSYQIWLETRFNGKYAIIWPTALYMGALILNRLQTSMLKLVAAEGGSQ